jgi:predicted RNA-binding protein with RPS1 domain
VGKEPSSFSKGDTVSVKVINIRKDGKVEFSLVE